jgi:4-hydroxybenzoate polyprenyltransferase
MAGMAHASLPSRLDPRRMLEALGDLALLPAIYVAAATALFAALTEATISPAAIAFAALVAWPVYLLDRVKWRDAWLDPADAAAHPRRQALLHPRRVAIRAISLAMLGGASLIAWRLAPSPRSALSTFAIGLPMLAAIGAWVYAGRPRRQAPRPKDLLPLKSPAVGVAIAAFSCMVTLAFDPRLASIEAARDFVAQPPSLFALGAIALRVTGDAIWCDLDDAASDRRHRTASVPATCGVAAGWWIGGLLCVTGASLALAGRPDALGVTAASAAAIGTMALFLGRPTPARDLAELRLPLEAALVLAVQTALS